MTFPIRGILKLTGDLLRRGWLPMVLVSVLNMLPHWATQYLQSIDRHSGLAEMFVSAHGFGPAAWLLIAISWFMHGFHMSAVTEIALRTAASKPLKVGRLLRNASVNALPILLLHTLLELIIAAGGLLLVVPGLLLGATFSVIVPAYICEGKNLIEAFRQSFKLTRNRRLFIVGLWLVIFLTYGLITGSLLSAAHLFEGEAHRFWPALPLPNLPLSEPLVTAYSSPISILFFTIALQTAVVAFMVLNVAIYLGLRFQKTDPADNQIAAIFE